MKYLFLIALLILGCSKNEPTIVKTYPGHQKSWQVCHDLWNLGYKFDVAKCEKDTENPRFKMGQKVKFSMDTRFDSSYFGVVTSLYWYRPAEEQNSYRLKVFCTGGLLDDNIIVDESSLRSTK